MIRKLLSTILCLILALTVPLGSLAATEATLSIIPGDEMAKQQVVSDVLDTFAIRFAGDASVPAGSIGIMIGGESLFDLALRVSPDGLYLESAVLGDKALCFPWESIAKFVQELIKKSGFDFSQIAGTFGHLPQGIPVSITGLTDGSLSSKEQIVAKMKEAFSDDPVITELIDDLLSRVVTTEGEFTSEAHDAATTKTELIITGADYVKAADSKRLRDVLQKIVDQQFSSYSDAEKAAELDKLIEQVKKVYSDLNLSVSISVLTAKDDKHPVSMIVELTADGSVEATTTKDGKSATENVPVKLSAPMIYNRLTSDTGVRYSGNMTVDVNDKAEAILNGYLDRNKDETAQGVLGTLIAGVELNFTYSKVKSGDVKNRLISVFYRDNATSLLEPSASDRPLISFKLETKPADESIFAAVKSATPDSSVKLLEMSESELQSYTSGLMTRLTQLLYTLLGKLPQSVIEALGPMLGN